MLNLTSAQIASAKSGDMDAASEILAELKPRIAYVARDAATVAGHLDHSLVNDYVSEANLAVLLALPKFQGETVGELSRYVDLYIKEAVDISRRDEVERGLVYDLPNHTRHTYERALAKAGGDADKAEQLAQSSDEFGPRALAASTASLARAASQRVEYLDAPAGRGEGSSVTLADTLTEDNAAVVRPHRTVDQNRTHQILEEMRAASPRQAEVLEYAAGLNGKTVASGMEHKRTKQGDRWTLRDATGVAEVLGASVQTVRTSWNNAKKGFAARWVSAYGVRSDSRERQPITEKGVALMAAIEVNDTHVFVKSHGRHVEFKHINDEFDVVCTWTTRSRAVELGILAG